MFDPRFQGLLDESNSRPSKKLNKELIDQTAVESHI